LSADQQKAYSFLMDSFYFHQKSYMNAILINLILAVLVGLKRLLIQYKNTSEDESLLGYSTE
jgi:hypothetical protein